VTPLWIINGLSVTATAAVIQELAARPDVRAITPDAIAIVPAGIPAAGSADAGAVEANLSAINAPALWSLGFQGQGVVVANMDTGVDLGHPDLATRYRGGANSWFDPYGQHAAPADLTGHGTATMGLMVGGDAGGSSIGVAPQAQWIAVKIFDDSGSATATAIHLGYQWLLDPDGNPDTPDAPRVVNNSWTFGSPGCNLAFQPDLQVLRAAGILPVFAAGNYGPAAASAASPANYPEALAVGSINNEGQIDASSSRGPAACGQSGGLYPALVAPGVNILSSDRFGLYSYNSGSSLAAPHAAGVLALLLSAYPELTVYQQAAALASGADDLGDAGLDNTFGYGRLDALASYQWLQAGGVNATPSPTPLPTATATPPPMPSSSPIRLFLPVAVTAP
jgi:subtilisin family serine protease